MEDIKNEFLKNIIIKATEQQMQIINAEKRKKHFQDIGRKGGSKKKSTNPLTKIISFRLTNLEYQESQIKSQDYNLKLSAYVRMVDLQKELKIKEFETDKVLVDYGNNFIRIKNLLRHREWTIFANKNKIIGEIEEILELIRNYLYSKMKTDDQNN